MARALVTGGAGFIGSHVVDRLVAGGHEVAVLDNLSSGRRENVHPAARLLEADLREPAAGDAVRALRPELVFHLAAQIDVRKSVADPSYDASVNIMGLLSLLEACVAVGAKRFVFSSSGGTVYGDATTIPTPETAPLDPLSPYGISKLASEKYVFFRSRIGELPGVCLRYANVYGPRQDPHGEAGVVAIFGGRLLRGEPCAIYGDGEATRDYVNVADVAAANMAALDCAAGEAINIATERETSVNGLYAMIARATGSTLEPEHRPARTGELQRSSLAIGRAREVLGWSPQVDLEAGIGRYIEFLRTQTR